MRKRNGLSLRRKTSVAQQDPEWMIAKLVSYIIQVKDDYRRSTITAPLTSSQWMKLHFGAIWYQKSITLKTTGHEKARVSVCLAAKADGTKLKTTVVFKGAKREVAALNEEFKHRAVVATSVNGWMDTELTQTWINSVLGAFSFNRRLLAWDSYECHILRTASLTPWNPRKSIAWLFREVAPNTYRRQT